MSKTNTPLDSFPILRVPGSPQTSKVESIPAMDKDAPCLTADNEPITRISEIAALRAFFQLLDQWDRNERGE